MPLGQFIFAFSLMAFPAWSQRNVTGAWGPVIQWPHIAVSVAHLAGSGLCGCAADHQNSEIYSPWYLYDASGNPAVRPAISTAPMM